MSVLGPMLPATPDLFSTAKKRIEAVAPPLAGFCTLPQLDRALSKTASDVGFHCRAITGKGTVVASAPDRSTTAVPRNATRRSSTPDLYLSADWGDLSHPLASNPRQLSRRVTFTALPTVAGERPLTNAVGKATPTSTPTQGTLHAYDDCLAEIQRMPRNLSPAPAGILSLLPPKAFHHHHRNTLLLDIDETLIHASFSRGARYDAKIVVPTSEGMGNVYIAFRPGLFPFLRAASELFELAVFTASESTYAAQVMNLIDAKGLVSHRLTREHCSEVNGTRVKDLSLLGRPLERAVIIDNSPAAYLFQPRNAIPIRSWFGSPSDDELMSLLPLLTRLAMTPNVYDVLDQHNARLLSVSKRAEAQARSRAVSETAS